MYFIAWIIFGGLAGWIASLLMNTDQQQGTLLNIVLGVVGAIIGGLLMNAFGIAGVTGFNVYSFVVAIIGAVVLIWLGKLVYR